jgi:omega-6 fatty acid desaturase (delta-12 desaturase)
MMAVKPFASELRTRSWWHLVSTFLVLFAAASLAAVASWWPLRLAASLMTGLTLVRAFILFHDLHHGAIFRGSPLAKAILNAYGLVLLTPPRVWRDTHNYHHAHTARTHGAQRGSFRLLTVAQWHAAGRGERLAYRVERHPLTILLGYVTVFVLALCLGPVLRRPRRYWDSGLALLAHGAVGASLWLLGGPGVFLFAFFIPFLVADAFGAYLFYAQHTFEGVVVPDPAEWNHTEASLEACSYLRLGPVMRWFTGNIGYHHVHHLNPRVPFYRLPGAMAAIPELARPTTITLGVRTVIRSFRLKLWDPEQGRMVGYTN